MSDFIPMVKYKKCSFCGSENFKHKNVSTSVKMLSEEIKNPFTGAIEQMVSFITDAYICNDCGHIDFFDFGQDRNKK